MRARLMHAAPAGAMVAVASSPDDIAAHLTADVDLAAINEFGSCVVAGPEEAIRDFTNRLAAAGIVARRVRTSHGFHSQSMDCGARAVRRVPVHADAACAANPDAVQRDRHLDDRRGGHRSESLGPAHPVHRAVRRRTPDPARRHPPGARRGGARRQSDRIGRAHARVVGHPPRGSPDAPPRADPGRSGRLPAGAGTAVVGRSRRGLDAAVRRAARASDAARLCLCAAASLDRARTPTRCGKPVGSASDAAAEAAARQRPGRSTRRTPARRCRRRCSGSGRSASVSNRLRRATTSSNSAATRWWRSASR